MEIDRTPDRQNMYEVLLGYPDQIAKALSLASQVKARQCPRILIAGMGGSAFPGEILKSYLPHLDITTSRDYTIPSFVGKDTLVFVVSFSGNTEETVSAFRHALRVGAQCVVVCSGGKLQEIASIHKHPTIIVPSGMQPRDATCLLFFAMLRVLENSGYLPSAEKDVQATIRALKSPLHQKMALEFVERLDGKIPLIYASSKMACAARRWKIGFNENTKIHAFVNEFPELNHNEMVGFTSLKGPFSTIILRDQEEEPQIIKRMQLTKDIIRGKGTPVVEVAVKGECYLSRIFSALYVGVWASYYLALHYNQDPTPVAIIEELKEKLKK
ncbi:bifunctional phosphoglucose/phosphomannose isomerase [Candidatus Woesearchaeota archaeon]|nr:bifunctional phosphoglucose/phosphomannose isomerase [Candidatus Woesearchaeota archaeon]